MSYGARPRLCTIVIPMAGGIDLMQKFSYCVFEVYCGHRYLDCCGGIFADLLLIYTMTENDEGSATLSQNLSVPGWLFEICNSCRLLLPEYHVTATLQSYGD